jgi:hypothetical protein
VWLVKHNAPVIKPKDPKDYVEHLTTPLSRVHNTTLTYSPITSVRTPQDMDSTPLYITSASLSSHRFLQQLTSNKQPPRPRIMPHRRGATQHPPLTILNHFLHAIIHRPRAPHPPSSECGKYSRARWRLTGRRSPGGRRDRRGIPVRTCRRWRRARCCRAACRRGSCRCGAGAGRK